MYLLSIKTDELTDDIAESERVIKRVRSKPGLCPRVVRPTHRHEPRPLVRVFVAAVYVAPLHGKPDAMGRDNEWFVGRDNEWFIGRWSRDVSNGRIRRV